MNETVILISAWLMAAWGVFTREEEHAGIGKMVIAILIMLHAIYIKL